MTQQQLPDPRPLAGGDAPPLMQAAGELANASAALRSASLRELANEIARLLERGEEAALREALQKPSSARACRALYEALDAALSPGSVAGGVNLQLFAIPVLFVVGAPTARRVSGVLPETDAIRSLFEQSGALGHCRNFGLSNVLASLESMRAIPWARLSAIAAARSWDGLTQLNLSPADIDVPVNRESVQLRFMSGAALTPSEAPAFVEAAGDIGRWGMQLTKELGRQLAAPDLSLLAIPRAPRSIVRAIQEGWLAARELGFQLFLSNALRQARLRIGEPDVTITSCSDQTVRIRLTSPFDDLLDQTYAWPLAPADDLDTILGSILGLLEDARVDRIRLAAAIEVVANVKQAAH